jgi:hypothetical protein
MGIAETIEWLQRECREGKWHLAVNVTIRQALAWLPQWLFQVFFVSVSDGCWLTAGRKGALWLPAPALSPPQPPPTSLPPTSLLAHPSALQQLHPQAPHPLPVALCQHGRVLAQAGGHRSIVFWALRERLQQRLPLLVHVVLLFWRHHPSMRAWSGRLASRSVLPLHTDCPALQNMLREATNKLYQVKANFTPVGISGAPAKAPAGAAYAALLVTLPLRCSCCCPLSWPAA